MVKELNLPEVIEFDWDTGNLEHIKKHQVEYSECEEIFYDEPIFFYDEEHSIREELFLAYGTTDEDRLLTIVFTLRNKKVRTISARNQSRTERDVYRS